jgi:Zn-dependent protease with chaperone function
MQISLLMMVLLIFVHDAELATVAAGAYDGYQLAAIVVLPKLALAIAYASLCFLAHRSLMKARDLHWVNRLDRMTGLYRIAAIVLYANDVYSGLLLAIREHLGDMVLLDELCLMLPTLGLIAFGWWCYYPIDRRLREATLLARIDSGQVIYPIWTRGQYMLAQLRHQMALVLVPLLALLAWVEALMFYLPDHLAPWSPAFMLGGAAVVFLLSPLMIRHIWDTTPLPAGELRDMLTSMCRTHRVGVHELLLWRTYGGVINAAVMGIVAPLRYILLTDALLDMMPLKQVEAVMAHELAHVRKHHMFWLIVVAGATSGLLQLGLMVGVSMIEPPQPPTGDPVIIASMVDALLGDPRVVEALAATAAIAGWVVTFGWVSRRFERQADSFAVAHLARESGNVVDEQAVHVMVGALGHVASLNHIPAARRSWRHGSIAWRQDYLRSLVGCRVDRLPIDRQVVAIKLFAIVAMATLIAAGAISTHLGL